MSKFIDVSVKSNKKIRTVVVFLIVVVVKIFVSNSMKSVYGIKKCVL